MNWLLTTNSLTTNGKWQVYKTRNFGKYTRNLTDFTFEDVNGYPSYKRIVIEPIEIGKILIDNKWVVPYNPYIRTKYNAHINIEICTSIKAIKYLYKYIYKCHDSSYFKYTVR
jgi:hypothetical protein